MTRSSRRPPTAGIRITLLDACYLRGGDGAELAGVQRRFGDGDVERWAERVDALASVGASTRPDRRRDPQRPRRRSGRGRDGGRVGRRARRAPARARVGATGRERARASRPTDARRPVCSPTPVRSTHDSPRCTRPTSPTTTSRSLGRGARDVLPVPDDRARSRRRRRPRGSPAATRALRSRSEPTRTR